jgi:carbamate kinase
VSGTRKKPILNVVAFGGNALIRSNEEGYIEEQVRNAELAVAALETILLSGEDIIIVHGNGPQVGQELLRQEEASTKLPSMPLDACVANTQGSMGYLLERAFRNYCKETQIDRPVATLLSQVLVNRQDPGFKKPTKPVGPFYTPYRARQLIRQKGWTLVEDAGRGFRTVVASPMPLEVLGLDAARALLRENYIVIMGGGGGIPVSYGPQGGIEGVEAVIDKDFTSRLIATEMEATRLILLTEVDYASIHFGTKKEKPLKNISMTQMHEYYDEGHFPAGSMGPKVLAGIEFIRNGGSECIITSAACLPNALLGQGGTRITNPT